MSQRTSVVVTCVLSVELTEEWGDDCTLEQVFKNSALSAQQHVRYVLGENERISVKSIESTSVLTVREGER